MSDALHSEMTAIMHTIMAAMRRNPDLRGFIASGVLGIAYAMATEQGIDPIAFIEQLKREQAS